MEQPRTGPPVVVVACPTLAKDYGFWEDVSESMVYLAAITLLRARLATDR